MGNDPRSDFRASRLVSESLLEMQAFKPLIASLVWEAKSIALKD